MGRSLLLLLTCVGCVSSDSPDVTDSEERPYFQVCALSQPREFTCQYLQEAISTANEENAQHLTTDIKGCTVFQMYCGFVKTW